MSMADNEARAFWLSLPPLQITYAKAMALPDYSASYPTGVTIGKTWRREDGGFDHAFKAAGGRPRWRIMRYEEVDGDAKVAAITSYRAHIRVKMGRRDDRVQG